MKKKLYDNYDYEEAYQKQIENLEAVSYTHLTLPTKLEV